MGNIPAGEGDNNGRSGSSSSKSDSSNNKGGTVKPAQRESAGLLAGLMSEVRISSILPHYFVC